MSGDKQKLNAFWSLESSWEVSPVWELKMHIVVEELEGLLVGYSHGNTGGRERWFFEEGVMEENVFMMTSLFLLLVNRLRESSLRLLHWLKTKKNTSRFVSFDKLI